MAGTTATVTIEDGPARAALDRLVTLGRDLGPMMDEIGEALRDSAVLRFEQGRAPDGTPWKPSRRALEEGGRTLIDTTRLQASLTYLAREAEVEVGTNTVYAAIHQFGGTIRPRRARSLVFRPSRGGERVARGSVTMPARPFLGLSADDAREVEAIAARELERAVGGPSGAAGSPRSRGGPA